MSVIQAVRDVEIISISRIEELKSLATSSPLQRARILLHEDESSYVQEMVIALKFGSYVKPHKHPVGKSESYHIIEGRLRVNIFHEDGKPEDSFVLGSGNNMYRLRGGIYHQPVALTKWVVYHETYTGPFNKERDVIYAPW